MQVWLPVAWVALAVPVSGLDPCRVLATGVTTHIRIPPAGPACLTVRVAPAQATQLTANQPSDLALLVTGPSGPITIDSFQFGQETATLTQPGDFRIDVRQVSGSPPTSILFVMSSKGLPLQTGLRWREAEEKATLAARLRKVDDIAESYRLWERLGDASTMARTHLKRGDAAARNAEYTAARASYETALTDCRRRGDVRCIAEAANNSGLMALQMGDSPQSSSRLQEAATAWRATGLVQNEGITLSNLGLLLWQTADFQGAISYFTRARAILQPRDPVGHTKVLNNLGLCYESLGEFALARTHYELAVAGFLRAKVPAEAAKARVNLGRTYLIEMRLDQAESFLRQALSGAAAAADRATVAAAQANLGQVLLARHLPDQAAAILLQALAAHRELRDKRFQALEHHHLGLAARAKHETGPARASLRAAADIRLATGFRDAASDSLFSLAELERDAGHPAAARKLLEQAIQLSESTRMRVPGGALRASFYARKRRLFDLLVDLTAASGTPAAAALSLVSAERGRSRALLDLLGEGSLLRHAPAELLARRRDTQQRLDLVTHLLSRADGAREADLRRQVDELLAEDAGIEASIRQTLPFEKSARPLSSIEELSQALPGGAALLEYHLGERASYLWLVTRTVVQVFPLPPRAELESRTRPLIEAFGRALERKRSAVEAQQFARDLDRVSETLLGPLKAIALPARVVVSPDGILARLPFAALRTRSGGSLGLDHDLSQVVSASHLLAGRKPRPATEFPQTVLAFADPVFSARDPRLARLTLSGPVASQSLARLPF